VRGCVTGISTIMALFAPLVSEHERKRLHFAHTSVPSAARQQPAIAVERGAAYLLAGGGGRQPLPHSPALYFACSQHFSVSAY